MAIWFKQFENKWGKICQLVPHGTKIVIGSQFPRLLFSFFLADSTKALGLLFSEFVAYFTLTRVG